MNPNIIWEMSQRTSPKLFLQNNPPSDEDIANLVKMANLTPTSMGLQLTRILFITDESIKSELRKVSYFQNQIDTCGVLAVLCTKLVNYEEDIDKYILNLKKVRDETSTRLEMISKVMNGFLESKSESDKLEWARNQTYITLGSLISYCAVNYIDCCPMEGFNQIEYASILKDQLGDYEPTVLLALGEVSPDCVTLDRAKVRISDDEYNILGKSERTL